MTARSIVRRSIGMRRAASAEKSSKSKTTSGSATKAFVICVENTGYPASLEVGKVYRSLGAPQGGPAKRLRVVDESGEDYVYPVSFFRPIQVSLPVQRALARAA